MKKPRKLLAATLLLLGAICVAGVWVWLRQSLPPNYIESPLSADCAKTIVRAIELVPVKLSDTDLERLSLGIVGPAAHDRMALVSPAVDELRRAARMADCTWGIDAAKGFRIASDVQPVAAGFKRLALATEARATLRSRLPNSITLIDESVRDDLALIHVARRLGNGTPIDLRLMAIGAEQLAVQQLVKLIADLSTAQLRSLRDALNSLPAPGALSLNFEFDKRMILAELELAPQTRSGLLADLSTNLTSALVSARFDNAKVAATVPYTEFAAAWQGFLAQDKTGVTNPLFAKLDQVYLADQSAEAHRRMLLCMIAICLDDPQGKTIIDPGTGKPFQFSVVRDTGHITVTSEVQYRNEDIRLSVNLVRTLMPRGSWSEVKAPVP